MTQSEKFDAEGNFVRRYLPQLAKLTLRQIHAPRLLTPAALQMAGIELGQTYPASIVMHDEERLLLDQE